MLKKNNKEKTLKEFNDNKIESIFNIIPNLSDKVLDFVEENYNILGIIKNTFNSKRKYNTDISDEVVILSGVQARMKQQLSITELGLSLTSNKIIEKLGLNISYLPKDSLLKEANIRSWLEKYEQEDIKKEKEIQRELGIKKKIKITSKVNFNNDFITFFNEFTKQFKEITRTECNTHILDCSILDVNLNNENYEGSTVTTKGNKELRGYKVSSLRGITKNGGMIEEICMNTAKIHDLEMSRDFVLNSETLKENDYLLMDRGFLDIDFFKELNKKKIKVIIPAKKNMEIYHEAIESAKNSNNWIKHPNKKRKGQSITLVKSLEMAWLSSQDKNKKPTNLELDYKINCCVIRFEISKNKELLTDEEIINSDGSYAYACIITNDTSLDCSDIIRMYEMRSEIEEDYRQLKDFWGLNTYKSTQNHIISFIILISLLGYNFYQIYKESEEGKEYIGKSFITEGRKGLYIVKGVRTAIVTEHFFGIFELEELLDIYANFSIEKRNIFKEYLAN